jgi:AraC-like DNA-binding protein
MSEQGNNLPAQDDDSLLPRLQLRTEQLPPSRRYEVLAAELGSLFELRASWSERRRMQGAIDGCLAGEMVAGSTSFSAVSFRRSHARIGADDLDHCLVQLYIRGGFEGEADGRQIAVGEGDVCIFDLSRPLHTRAGDSTNLSLVLPRQALERNTDTELPHGVRLSGRGALGRILGEHLRTLHRVLPETRLSEAAAVVESSAALVGAALSDIAYRGDGDVLGALPRVMRHRVKRHIMRHLQDTELTPDSIAAALNVSRSYLYRLFQPVGGVRRFIIQQRLRLVHRQLLDPANNRHPVSTIAYACGFRSDSHFCRVFREFYGYTPGDVRAGAGLCGYEESPARLSSWLGESAMSQKSREMPVDDGDPL